MAVPFDSRPLFPEPGIPLNSRRRPSARHAAGTSRAAPRSGTVPVTHSLRRLDIRRTTMVRPGKYTAVRAHCKETAESGRRPTLRSARPCPGRAPAPRRQASPAPTARSPQRASRSRPQCHLYGTVKGPRGLLDEFSSEKEGLGLTKSLRPFNSRVQVRRQTESFKGVSVVSTDRAKAAQLMQTHFGRCRLGLPSPQQQSSASKGYS